MTRNVIELPSGCDVTVSRWMRNPLVGAFSSVSQMDIIERYISAAAMPSGVLVRSNKVARSGTSGDSMLGIIANKVLMRGSMRGSSAGLTAMTPPRVVATLVKRRPLPINP